MTAIHEFLSCVAGQYGSQRTQVRMSQLSQIIQGYPQRAFPVPVKLMEIFQAT